MSGCRRREAERVRNGEGHLIDAFDAGDVFVHLQFLPCLGSELYVRNTLLWRWGSRASRARGLYGAGKEEHGTESQEYQTMRVTHSLRVKTILREFMNSGLKPKTRRVLMRRSTGNVQCGWLWWYFQPPTHSTAGLK